MDIPEKSDLISTIQQARQELERLLSEIPEEDMRKPGVSGDWSIKDLLAHLTAWQDFTMYRLRYAEEGTLPPIPPLVSEDDFDKQNEKYFSQHQDTSLADVLINFRNTHQKMLAYIHQMDESFLNSKLPEEWFGGGSVIRLIMANTSWHDIEHLASIEKWLS